ncbi:hypothetical protein HDU76_004373 [Blyttiomyces sp. JEL0837]|nr:hypothetical protein HDU76_004373 [Blyttiomyces sp. JEL0837]
MKRALTVLTILTTVSTSFANQICGTTSSNSVVFVTNDLTAGTRSIQSNGCPGYDWTSQTTPNKAQVHCNSFSVPTKPIINSQIFYIGVYKDLAKTVANPKIPLGTIGIARNGIVLYGNADAQDRDAFINEGHSFDTCEGHADGQGNYHYHAEPAQNCVSGYRNTSGTGHSDLLGLMADGIPLFGPYGDDGKVPTDLDECNGHVDSTYNFYHYHIAPTYHYPYLINCMKGCVNQSSGFNVKNQAPSCVPAETQYDYSALSSTDGLLDSTHLGSYMCDVNNGASITPGSISSPGSSSTSGTGTQTQTQSTSTTTGSSTTKSFASRNFSLQVFTMPLFLILMVFASAILL